MAFLLGCLCSAQGLFAQQAWFEEKDLTLDGNSPRYDPITLERIFPDDPRYKDLPEYKY